MPEPQLLKSWVDFQPLANSGLPLVFLQLAGPTVIAGHPDVLAWQAFLSKTSRRGRPLGPAGLCGPSGPSESAPSPCPANMPAFLVFPTSDDDIVFEDFARLRLKGLKDEDYDDQFC